MEEHRPKTVEDLRSLGVRLKWIGWGSFRQVYEVRGLPIVVKFPHHGDPKHSRTEMRRIEKLHKIPTIRRHLPKIFYYDKTSGVIVTPYYKKRSPDVRQCLDLIARLLGHIGVRTTDLRLANVRSLAYGFPVFVDLGY